MEITKIAFTNGKVLNMLTREIDEGLMAIGFFEVLPNKQTRIWEQTWHDRYAPTNVIFPGPVSAIRALILGNV